MEIVNNTYMTDSGVPVWFVLPFVVLIVIFLISIIVAVHASLDMYSFGADKGSVLILAMCLVGIVAPPVICIEVFSQIPVEKEELVSQIKDLGFSDIRLDRGADMFTAERDEDMHRCMMLELPTEGDWKVICED